MTMTLCKHQKNQDSSDVTSSQLPSHVSSFLFVINLWLIVFILSFLSSLFFLFLSVTQQGEGDTCERLVAYLSSLPTLPAVALSDF